MREQAAQIRDPFISGGFIALAEQYEQLAAGEAHWTVPAHSAANPEANRMRESGPLTTPQRATSFKLHF